MNPSPTLSSHMPTTGVALCAETASGASLAHDRFMRWLGAIGLADFTTAVDLDGGTSWHYCLGPAALASLAPDHDTTRLCESLHLDTEQSLQDLDTEILAAMLASPVVFRYPSFDELESAVRVRRNIVIAARNTALAFDTEHAERPEDCWDYSEACGFTLKEGVDLIEALRLTTQPDRSNRLYSFSCYRATEYVLLLALAQELELSNPPSLKLLQQQWQTRAIMSGRFHDVFLREYGSMDEPLPPRFYIPGDRLWFRNPDAHSSNAEGYEGSWVFYIGNGRYTNFWKRDQPFTLTSKCVELYHWRNATYLDSHGKLHVDDDVVDALVAESLRNPVEVAAILAQMLRLRDPGGVYADGGCIDTSRECVRLLRPGTSELVFPDVTDTSTSEAS